MTGHYVCASVSVHVCVGPNPAHTQAVCMHTFYVKGKMLLTQADVPQSNDSHVLPDEPYSRTIRLCFCNKVEFCLQLVSTGRAHASVFTTPQYSWNTCLIFFLFSSKAA